MSVELRKEFGVGVISESGKSLGSRLNHERGKDHIGRAHEYLRKVLRTGK